MDDSASVGASTSVFGIFTGQMVMIFVNWRSLSSNPQLKTLRNTILGFAVFCIVLNFMSNSAESNKTTDINGHIGGAITGFIWGMAFFKRDGQDEHFCGITWRKIGYVAVSLWFLGMIIIFFGFRKPVNQYYPYGTDEYGDD